MIKPMLAAKLDMDKVRYPVFVSPKVDGIRCVVENGHPMSRTAKEIPNRYLRNLVHDAREVLELVDGELVVGSPKHPNVMQKSMSGLMSEMGIPAISFLVFDLLRDERMPYVRRLEALRKLELPTWCKVLPQVLVKDARHLEKVEQQAVKLGYEGVIVRAMKAPYKQGRSTVREGYLLKLKRYEDSEAVVIGVEELMHNDNPAFTDEQGRTVHTSHKAGQRPGNKLGALVVQLLESNGTRAEYMPHFNIGTGFDDATRIALWKTRDQLVGKIVKFKYLPHGVLNAPRHPVFLGFRDQIDL